MAALRFGGFREFELPAPVVLNEAGEHDDNDIKDTDGVCNNDAYCVDEFADGSTSAQQSTALYEGELNNGEVEEFVPIYRISGVLQESATVADNGDDMDADDFDGDSDDEVRVHSGETKETSMCEVECAVRTWCFLCEYHEVNNSNDQNPDHARAIEYRQNIHRRLQLDYGRVRDLDLALAVQALYNAQLREDNGGNWWSLASIIAHVTDHDVTERISVIQRIRTLRKVQELLEQKGIKLAGTNHSKPLSTKNLKAYLEVSAEITKLYRRLNSTI